MPGQNTLSKTPEFISRKEMGLRLGLDQATIWRLEKKGIVTSFKIGRTVRFNWDATIAKFQQTEKENRGR